MKLPVPAKFVDRTTLRAVSGQIRAATFEDMQAQAVWKYPASAQDAEWNWAELWLPSITSPGDFECYAARVGRELHGLMAVDLRGHDSRDGRALVVEYLATNPADRNTDSGLKYLGVALMAAAVIRSIELGFGGRLWLESLPNLRTRAFYSNIGMTQLAELSKEGYAVFVFDMERAKEFLEQAKAESWIATK